MPKRKIVLTNTTSEYNSMRQGLTRINEAIDSREVVYSKMGVDKLRQIIQADKVLADGLMPLYLKMKAVFGRATDGDI